MPAPATLPRLMPTLNPSGFITAVSASRQRRASFHKIGEFLVRQPVQVGDFLVRHDHQMPAVVGITVQQRETGAVAHDDQIVLVIGRLRDAREQTFLQFRLSGDRMYSMRHGAWSESMPKYKIEARQVIKPRIGHE